MTRRYVGAGLVALGVLLALLVIPLWVSGSQDADKEQLARDYAEAISGQPFDDAEADRTAPLVLGAFAAVAFLAGVIVLVSPSSDS